MRKQLHNIPCHAHTGSQTRMPTKFFLLKGWILCMLILHSPTLTGPWLTYPWSARGLGEATGITATNTKSPQTRGWQSSWPPTLPCKLGWKFASLSILPCTQGCRSWVPPIHLGRQGWANGNGNGKSSDILEKAIRKPIEITVEPGWNCIQ